MAAVTCSDTVIYMDTKLHTVVVDMVDVEPLNNDRTQFDPSELEALAASIDRVGLLSPITIRPKPDGNGYHLIAGERRWRAHQLLARETIVAIITDDDDRTAKQKMLAENTGRVNLNPIDEARAYQERVEVYDESIEDVAAFAGVQPAHVRWRLGLLKLDPEVQALIGAGTLKHTTGEALVGLDRDRQLAVLQVLSNRQLTLDEIWKLCDRMRNEQNQDSMFDPSAFAMVADEWVDQAQEENVALTIRQLAVLVDEVLAELPLDLDEWAGSVGGSRASRYRRLRAALDYRIDNKKKGR